MTAPTPAVERAARELSRVEGEGAIAWRDFIPDATAALTAALTDPDDPDSLARTLFVLHLSSDPNMIPGEESLELWPLMSEGSRVHWRAVADGFRMMLTGSGS